MSLVAHQKHFVLGPLPIVVRPDWRTVRIAEGLILSHCPKLRIQQLQSKNGVPYWLVGIAVRADEPSAISEGFPLRDSAEIENWSGFWAGRWCLISADRCWQDVTGCFGIYHRRVGTRAWISNSSALLGDYLPGAPSATRLPWQIVDSTGIDWIPPPFSTREGIYRLLPLRTIEPQTGGITPLRFDPPPMNTGEEIQAVVSALKTIMTNWAQADFRERFMALTAGLDTRSILAAAVAAKIDVKAFTTCYPITMRRDLRLPPRIAARVGVPHTLRRLPAVDAREAEAGMAAIAEHMDGTGWHRSIMYMGSHAYDLLNDPGQTVAHGNVVGGKVAATIGPSSRIWGVRHRLRIRIIYWIASHSAQAGAPSRANCGDALSRPGSTPCRSRYRSLKTGGIASIWSSAAVGGTLSRRRSGICWTAPRSTRGTACGCPICSCGSVRKSGSRGSRSARRFACSLQSFWSFRSIPSRFRPGCGQPSAISLVPRSSAR